jgi:Ca2+/H+ antiporter
MSQTTQTILRIIMFLTAMGIFLLQTGGTFAYVWYYKELQELSKEQLTAVNSCVSWSYAFSTVIILVLLVAAYIGFSETNPKQNG